MGRRDFIKIEPSGRYLFGMVRMKSIAAALPVTEKIRERLPR